jgi:hypothetical protein
MRALRIIVGFAAVRFFDRLNRAATKVYALSRVIFNVLSRSFSGLLPIPHRLSLAAAHGAAMRSLARFMFIAIATN